jgi:hypothetical protein
MPVVATDPGKLNTKRYLDFQAFAVAHQLAKNAMPIGDFAVAM